MDEQNLPIDIQLKKLSDWLISRRICNRQWHENIVQIREKIGHAIRDMPEHPEVKRLLSGANINYFHCLKIIEILKETEKDSRNFFGSYGSQRMKDWQEIVKLYQRENIYLAEAAQLLSQAVTYEILALKKQLSKAIQTQEECDKKEKDNNRKAKEFRNEFDKSCKQFGIEGKNIRREIINLLKELPNTYSNIASDCKQLKKVRTFYISFLEATLDETSFSSDETLPALSFLIDRGNVTTYEWMYGEPPLSIEEPQLAFEDENEDDEMEQQIDFTVMDDVELDTGGEIDWGNIEATSSEEPVEIDWNEGVEESAEIVVEEGGMEGGVARDSEALTLLDNRRTRTMILDELSELQCFLEQRLQEIQQANEGQFSLATNVLKEENKEVIVEGISIIAELMSKLNTGKLHHLQLIRSSPKYVDRLVTSLKSKLDLERKMEISNKVIQERRDYAIRCQSQAQTKMDLIKSKTNELQREIEKDISARYKNRPVNIMGGIQSV